MQDLAIKMNHRPGALASLGEILGNAGVSIEGGGVFVVDGKATAHFLFENAEAAMNVLKQNGFSVFEPRDILIQRLNQDEPGQLGKIARMMAAAGVNIEVMYSDHQNQLILVVDNYEQGKIVSEQWKFRHVKP